MADIKNCDCGWKPLDLDNPGGVCVVRLFPGRNLLRTKIGTPRVQLWIMNVKLEG